MTTESVDVEITPDPGDPDRRVATFPIFTAAEAPDGELLVTETSEHLNLARGQGFSREDALAQYKSALEADRAAVEAELAVYDQAIEEVDVEQAKPAPVAEEIVLDDIIEP